MLHHQPQGRNLWGDLCPLVYKYHCVVYGHTYIHNSSNYLSCWFISIFCTDPFLFFSFLGPCGQVDILLIVLIARIAY